MKKNILFVLFALLPLMAAAQEEIRTVGGETEIRKVRTIERQSFWMKHPQILLESKRPEGSPNKVPFTYMESIRFQDGCVMYFDENGLLFDQVKNPATLTVSRGVDLKLEGVYSMSKPEMKQLFGQEYYNKNIRPYRILYNAGEAVTIGGIILSLPLVSQELSKIFDSPVVFSQPHHETFQKMAIVGAVFIAGGATMCIIGHNGCKRVAINFTGTGVNLTSRF